MGGWTTIKPGGQPEMGVTWFPTSKLGGV